MDGKVALSVRSMVVAGVAVMALVIAYLVGASDGGTPSAAAATGETGQTAVRTVTMSGTGTAHAVPDELSFAVGVAQTRPSLKEALAAGNASMNAVLAALTRFGVQTKDVQTTGLNMYPVYDYHQSGPPTLRGYRVTQSASVLVRDLKKGGAAVNAAVAAGGNAVRVHEIRLVVGDPEGAMKKARDAAVADATAKATQYAEAAGQTLGDVITLREVNPSNPRVPLTYARAAAPDALSAAVPIRAGTDKLKVTVQVVWGFA
jgi:uncharacterized protein YggE